MTTTTGQLFSGPVPATNQLPGAELEYRPRFYSNGQANQLMRLLQNRLVWRHEPIILFGKKVLQPRLTSWIADKRITYKYSSIELMSAGWPGFLEPIRRAVETTTAVGFNSMLANCYRDGQDSMGWHADDEPELGANPLIASISLGATRRFVMRRKTDHRQKHELLLEHGSLLIMWGPTQHNWQHSIPKARNIASPRINLTFRQIKNND